MYGLCVLCVYRRVCGSGASLCESIDCVYCVESSY